MAKSSQDQIAKAVDAFVNAPTWNESKRIVEAQRDMLLTDAADQFLAFLLEQNKDDAHVTHIFENHRDLLVRCLRDGIEAAFADLLQIEEFHKLLSEIELLSSPKDMPRRVTLCQTALGLVHRDTQPQLWAHIQNQLAKSLAQNPRGERADNLEQAISLYEQALEVYVRQGFPEQWAATQNYLAIAYNNRILGERAESLEQAISLYQHVLEVYTRQAFPIGYAGTQNNLANAYQQRIRGERADNLEQSIHHYGQALGVRTPLTFPQDCRDTAYWLGHLLYDERRFSEARLALSLAHQAVEALRGEVQRDIAKRSLAEENADLYARLVFCCLQEGDEAAAFIYAAAGKGRAFVDLLATARLDLSAASANNPDLTEDLRKAHELRQQIDYLLATLTGESGLSLAGSSSDVNSEISHHTTLPPEVLSTQLRTLQAQEAGYWEEMAYKYPFSGYADW